MPWWVFICFCMTNNQSGRNLLRNALCLQHDVVGHVDALVGWRLLLHDRNLPLLVQCHQQLARRRCKQQCFPTAISPSLHVCGFQQASKGPVSRYHRQLQGPHNPSAGELIVEGHAYAPPVRQPLVHHPLNAMGVARLLASQSDAAFNAPDCLHLTTLPHERSQYRPV